MGNLQDISIEQDAHLSKCKPRETGRRAGSLIVAGIFGTRPLWAGRR